MARGNKKWLQQLTDILSEGLLPEYQKEITQKLSRLNSGAAGQVDAFNALEPKQRIQLLKGALTLAGHKDPDDIITKKFHEALLRHYGYSAEANELPDLHKWAKNYYKSPWVGALPEQRVPLEQIIKTRTGAVRNPIHSLYRLIRGNAYLNESKDLVSRVGARLWPWDPQVTTALSKLSKNGYIKFDPKSNVILVPRDVIRQIDPYYEKFNETLKELSKTLYKDFGTYTDQAEKRIADPTVTALTKEYIKEQKRRNLPRIPDDLPIEERNRLLAEQQAQLVEEPTEEDLDAAYRALEYKLSDLSANNIQDNERFQLLPRNHSNDLVRLASVFSEKGLRSLLNNPKRVIKLAQIAELLEDRWFDIAQPEGRRLWYPEGDDEDFRAIRNMIPLNEYKALTGYIIPSGPYKTGELNSLNNFDTFRRTLDENVRVAQQNEEQAGARIRQFIANHPELVEQERQNRQLRQQQERQERHGIPYVYNEEDDEEQRLLAQVRGGNYSNTTGNILKQPRLIELAERPYKYSKGVLDAINSIDTIAPWRLAKNRRELYERSNAHNICVGVPTYGYHNKVLEKKSLIFFHGDHADPESETGEITLIINPQNIITRAEVVQVHGIHNKAGSDTAIAGLQSIAKQLIGKSVDDTNNVVEQKGIEYHEEQPAGAIDPHEVHRQHLQDYALDNDYQGDLDDLDDDEAYNYANEQMRRDGYHIDDDGNWLAPGDPRYDDWDDDGNRIDPEEEEFDEDDPGYSGGGFVEPLGNPAYQRLLELMLEDGVTRPTAHQVSLATRRF